MIISDLLCHKQNGDLKVKSLKAILKDRKMIMRLAKNDFKTKFAGSYFGVIWAFAQPIVIVSIYWIVFDKGFRS